MSLGLFPDLEEGAIYFARNDITHELSSFSAFAFYLDEQKWPTVEHYYQAMKFNDTHYQDKIRLASKPATARRLGRNRFKKIRPDWKKVREIVMTRAIYTKCRTHAEVSQYLLDTGDAKLVENSQYDYFWGCGRDRRGKNTYGRVLMNVRQKLLTL